MLFRCLDFRQISENSSILTDILSHVCYEVPNPTTIEPKNMFGIAMTEIRDSGCGILVKKELVCGIMTIFPDHMLTVAVFLLASSPGDPLCAGVPDVLLEKAIINAGATEIDLKVLQNVFMDLVPF